MREENIGEGDRGQGEEGKLKELQRNTGRGRNWERDGERKDLRKRGGEAGEVERDREREMYKVLKEQKKKERREQKRERASGRRGVGHIEGVEERNKRDLEGERREIV